MTCKYSMTQFTIYTLVDITQTKQYRKELGKEKQKSQQQNFDMVIQTIGMRTNPSFISGPTVINDQLNKHKFGTVFSGTHNIWVFHFFTEHKDTLMDNNNNPCGLLLQDLNFVPFISSLDETVIFNKDIFSTQDPLTCNTIIFPSNYK